MSYEIRRTPKNKYQLRKMWEAGMPVVGPSGETVDAHPILGDFDTLELAADFALAHANGEYDWQPFHPADHSSEHRREVQEGNLRA